MCSVARAAFVVNAAEYAGKRMRGGRECVWTTGRHERWIELCAFGMGD